jgi:hypothetical protein
MKTNNLSHIGSRSHLVLGLCALAIQFTTGCHVFRPESQLSGVKGNYDAVRLSYQLPAGQLAPRSDAASGVKLASHQVAAAADRTGGETRVRTLTLQYPHPQGRGGYALAELVIEKPTAPGEQTPGATPEPAAQPGWYDRCRGVLRDNMPGVAYADNVVAAYALDIPMADVDRVVQLLDIQGYFAEGIQPVSYAAVGGAPAAEAPLVAARINGVDIDRPWRVTPELNDLVWRVRNEGRLVAHRQPAQRLRPSAPRTPLLLRLPPVVN